MSQNLLLKLFERSSRTITQYFDIPLILLVDGRISHNMEYEDSWKNLLRERFGYFLSLHHNNLQVASFEDFPPFDETRTQKRSEPFQAGPGVHYLRPGEALELPLEALRRVPRYLLAMTLMTDVNVVDSGHYEYWRATGAAASLHSDIMDSRKEHLDSHERMGELSREELIESFGYSMRQPLEFSELHDLMIVLQIGLLGERRPVYPPLDVDPTLYKITNYCFQIATRYGFPLLESLADYLSEGDHRRFRPRIESWFENSPNPATRRTLLEFDRLSDINPEYERNLDESKDIQGPVGVDEDSLSEYISRFDELTNPDEINDPEGEIDTRDGLIRELKEYRNPSQHGYGKRWDNQEQGIYRVPAVTIITLCCLAFWDGVTEDQFQDIRESLGFAGKSFPEYQERFRLPQWTPEDFYPKSILSSFED